MKITIKDGVTKKFLTKEEVLKITQEQLPLAVLSRNYYSTIAAEISCFDKTVWNHFMWMVHPGKFLTQDWILHEVPAEIYLQGKHQLKFWFSPFWPDSRRAMLIAALEKEVEKPWWKHRYDLLQLIGIRTGIRELQIPWMRICSDWADFILLLDDNYEGKHLTPGEVNRWFEGQPNYCPFGRFYPED